MFEPAYEMKKNHRRNHNHHALVLIRVTLIVPACQSGLEEMEKLRKFEGNSRKFEGILGEFEEI